ncbi:unnamed protein product [Scytosiphon promiscuus]
MAANGCSAGKSSAPRDPGSFWGNEEQPETSSGVYKESVSGSGIQSNKAAAAMTTPTVGGKKSVRQRSGNLQAPDANVAAAGTSIGGQNSNKTNQGANEKAEVKGRDQPNAMRAILLEAEIARSLNVQLQQQMALLEDQLHAQHHHITGLHAKVKALETELKSAKANAVAQPDSILPSSTAAALSLASHTVAPGSSSPPPTSSITATYACPEASTEQGQPETVAPGAPDFVMSPAAYDPCPGNACGLIEAPAAEAAAKQNGSGITPPGSEGLALGSDATMLTLPTESDVEAAPVSEVGCRECLCAGSPSPVVAHGDEGANDAKDAVAARGSGSDSDEDVVVIDNPSVRTSRKRRHSLRDFWNSNIMELDDTPPASNTRRHRHRAARQQQEGTSSPFVSRARDHAHTDPAVTPGASRNQAAVTSTAGERGASLAADPAAMAAPSQGNNTATNDAKPPSSTPVGDPVTQTSPRVVHSVVLRRAMEGREGAEGRSSHLMDCVSCQDALPDSESIARCDGCPRSFCAHCLERCLRERGVDVEGMDPENRALLDGKLGDFFVAQCQECLRDKDRQFSPPPEGTAPMDHLLGELLRHDLSLCFREPVDIAKHPDYVESIGRNAMMDLGTMARKLKERRYPRRRGPGQFLEDLNRIWRNCRRYAGCDELGKPHFGNTVPGIVRCAVILEALTLKYCAAHMSDNEGSASWQESTWDFYRQEQERANATARLKQLEGVATNCCEKTDARSPLPGDGPAQRVDPSDEDAAGMTEVDNASEQRNGSPGIESLRASSDSRQRKHTPTVEEGRKRSAATMEGAVGEGVQLGRTSQAGRILVDVTAANAESVSGATPKNGKSSEEDQQQSPWSPLDRLCDLATTYIQ